MRAGGARDILSTGVGCAAIVCLGCATSAFAQDLRDLGDMSIDELAQINVTSVSKTDQPLGDAPAAIYVISHDDIVRSGASSIPEMLRLAPNLQVAQQTPAKWVVTARGMSGNPAAQNFPNKLLVLVDGRAVYTPLFSGIYWDLPDVLPDDVDRIEVISGPGATLWGANAVNGVINIITRDAAQSTGLYADLRAGPDRQVAGFRYAASAGETLSFQVNARATREDAFRSIAGGSARDNWRRYGGGFRLDWQPGDRDHVTVIGQGGEGRLQQGAGHESTATRSLSIRWNRRTSDTGELQAQVYYDRLSRDDRVSGGGDFHVDTYDAEVQHAWSAKNHRLVAGAGARIASYGIAGTASLFFDPPRDDLLIANAFIQDAIALTPKLTAIAGLKLERLPYSGISWLPEARLAFKPTPTSLIWAAASRAVRSATPFDVSVEERAGIVSLSGNPAFRTEKLTALELGTRLQPSPKFSLSVTGFHHSYDDLKTVEVVPGPGLSLTWGNGIRGRSYGADAWADWRATPWWSLGAGLSVIERNFRFKPGATRILGLSQLGGDRPYTAKLHSSMNFGRAVYLDLDLRAAGRVSKSALKGYQELGGKLAWMPAAGITVSVQGTNLLRDGHREYPGGDRIVRRAMAGIEFAF